MLCESDPDSALKILNLIDRKNLGDSELPAYCLSYTMAQDKSGLDVDNDSLIRIAFEHYQNKALHHYYAKSQYYMGKYYLLNDSTERAKECFVNAKESAALQKDTATLCLSMSRLADSYYLYNQEAALENAQTAEKLYEAYSKATKRNIVLYQLNVVYCYNLLNRFDSAMAISKKALNIAYKEKDSVSMTSVFHYISLIYRKTEKYDSSLVYAKKMKEYWNLDGNYYDMTLANAFLAADSLDQAEKAFKNMLGDPNRTYVYTAYMRLHNIALRKNLIELAAEYADSAYQSLEIMYSESLEQRDVQFKELMAQEKKNYEIERTANRVKWMTCIVVLILCYLVFIYITYRKRAEERLQMEREKAELQRICDKEKHEKELSLQKEHHKQNLLYRDRQLDIMKKYLMEKLRITKKIQSIKDSKSKAIFTDEDWKEIEIFLESSECNFVSRLRADYPELREKDVRLMMLLRLKMPLKCIADGYGISEKSVRQKLFLYKEKVGIKDENRSLREFIESY